MVTLVTRELTEAEALGVMETIGDTPVLGAFVDGELVAVGVRYAPGDDKFRELMDR